MKKTKNLFIAIGLLVAFLLWTVLLGFVDVRNIGPESSSVGFATVNGFVHELVGVNMTLYTITDWLGMVPIAFALGFAVLGLVQLIKRRSLWAVDKSILVLGVFYTVVMAVFLLFEFIALNYRPVLIDGRLEASYPSSTTLLVLCVMPTSAMQLRERIKNKALGRCVILVIAVFTLFTVFGRILSGVHWITDILGGTMLSSGLVMLYSYSVFVLRE